MPLKIKDRYHRLRKYRACFRGNNLISSLIKQGFAYGKDDAEQLALELLHARLIKVTHKGSSKGGGWTALDLYTLGDSVTIASKRVERAVVATSKVKIQVRKLNAQVYNLNEAINEVEVEAGGGRINALAKLQAMQVETLSLAIITAALLLLYIIFVISESWKIFALHGTVICALSVPVYHSLRDIRQRAMSLQSVNRASTGGASRQDLGQVERLMQNMLSKAALMQQSTRGRQETSLAVKPRRRLQTRLERRK